MCYVMLGQQSKTEENAVNLPVLILYQLIELAIYLSSESLA